MAKCCLHRWLCCLMLLAVASAVNAQLTHYEYWFDNDFAGRHTLPWSADANGGISSGIETGNLDAGLHLLNIRVRQADGYYSPVSTQPFLNLRNDGADAMEYWLDDDFDHRASVTLGTGGSLSLPLEPLLGSQLMQSVGIHRINLRVRYGGVYTPVYSSVIFKSRQTDNPFELEYWLDDNVDIKSVTMAPGDSLFRVSLSDVSFGLHLFHTRGLLNGLYSPVSSSLVFKGVVSNKPTFFEYWFDNDFENVTRTSISLPDSIVSLSLPVSTKSGVHWFHSRILCGDIYSPIYSSVVLNGMCGDDMVMEYWLDNDFEHRGTLLPSTSGSVVAFADELDLSGSGPGLHMMHYRVADTSGLLAGPTDSTQVMVLRADKGDVNQDGVIDIGDVPALVSFIFGRQAATYSFSEADQNEDGKIQVNDLVMLINVILDLSMDNADAIAPRLASLRQDDGALSFSIDNPQLYTGVQFDLHLADGQNLGRITTGDASHAYLCRMIDRNTARVVVYSANNASFQNENVASIVLGGGATGDVTVSNIRIADANAITVPSQSLLLSDVTAVWDINKDEPDTDIDSDVFTTSGIRISNGSAFAGITDIPVVYIRNGRKELRE